MHDLILHHYAGSPFSEKFRLILGMKGVAWKSVNVPVICPKPDVVALTGGYRRTPFMQVGADIYCDTALMCRVLDRMHPSPALYPQAAGGAQHIVAQWADSALFWVAVPYTLQPAGAVHVFEGASSEMMKAFMADRAAMTTGMRKATLTDATAQLRGYLGWLEQQLADGRRFLCGEEASIADFSVAQSVWFIRLAPPLAAILAPFERLGAWYERVHAFGHGRHDRLSSTDAIGIARAAGSFDEVTFDESSGFARGQSVTVTPIDYAQDPVAGRLVGLSDEQISVEREDERAGLVHVHFPRVGYQLRKSD